MIFPEVSNRVLSPRTILPLSGFSIPAMDLSVMLLPQPEAPRIPILDAFPSQLT